jgi:hypothetical protein
MPEVCGAGSWTERFWLASIPKYDVGTDVYDSQRITLFGKAGCGYVQAEELAKKIMLCVIAIGLAMSLRILAFFAYSNVSSSIDTSPHLRIAMHVIII